MKAAKKLLKYVTRFEYAIMVIAFVIMVAAYFISVINRNFIKASMPWTEELALYSMTFMALLGTEVGLRDGTQVSVTAVVDKLNGTAKKAVSIIEQIVLVVFSFIMTHASIELVVRQMQVGQTTPVLKIPMAFMYSSLVLAFGIILLVQAAVLIDKIMTVNQKEANL